MHAIVPLLDWHDEGLREWVRLSLPLMVGVSLVTADNWIIAHFASTTDGAVSLMNYAKQLFTAPMAVLAQAAGAASMPFFASLWTQEQALRVRHRGGRFGFARGCLGLLAASGMIALGLPLVDLIFVGGRFSAVDARECAAYFAVFSVSMFLWSAQAIYARAFYAAGNTFAAHGRGNRGHGGFVAPLRSLVPLERSDGTGHCLRHRHRHADRDHRRAAASNADGLARQPGLRRDGPLCCSLPWPAAPWCGESLRECSAMLWRAMGRDLAAASRWMDLGILIVGTGLWLVITKWILEKTGSMLPQVAMKRLRLS